MSILVTGGCGFIASNFINVMKQRYPSRIFVNIDKLDYCSNLENVDEGVCVFLQGNICDVNFIEFVIKKYRFSTVFHFAAQSHVDNSFLNPTSFTIDNTYGTHVLLELCRKNIPNIEFIHFSTDEVFGPALGTTMFDEWDRHKPTNPYSASKSAAENICISYENTYKIPLMIVNVMNAFGERQHPEKFIPKCIRKVLAGETVHIHSYPDKRRAGTRFYIHARNIAAAVGFLLQNGSVGEKYNITGEKEVDNL